MKFICVCGYSTDEENEMRDHLMECVAMFKHFTISPNDLEVQNGSLINPLFHNTRIRGSLHTRAAQETTYTPVYTQPSFTAMYS